MILEVASLRLDCAWFSYVSLSYQFSYNFHIIKKSKCSVFFLFVFWMTPWWSFSKTFNHWYSHQLVQWFSFGWLTTTYEMFVELYWPSTLITNSRSLLQLKPLLYLTPSIHLPDYAHLYWNIALAFSNLNCIHSHILQSLASNFSTLGSD